MGRMQMLIINNLFILILMLLVSCNQKLKFIDDSNLLNKIEYKVNTKCLDSTIIFNIKIINNSSNNIYIPITNWVYDGKKNLNNPSFTQPVNSGLNCTIHYFPLGSNVLDAVIDIGWGCEQKNFFPSFLRIGSLGADSLNIEVSKYGINSTNQFQARFEDSKNYTFLTLLSIISEENLQKIVNDQFDLKYLVNRNPKIIIPTQKFNEFGTFLQESKFKLSLENCENLNRLGANKLRIQFDSKVQ